VSGGVQRHTGWHTCNMQLSGTRMCGRLAVRRQDTQDTVDLYKVVIGGEDICLLVFLFFSIY